MPITSFYKTLPNDVARIYGSPEFKSLPVETRIDYRVASWITRLIEKNRTPEDVARIVARAARILM